jgi:hypothetical protein
LENLVVAFSAFSWREKKDCIELLLAENKQQVEAAKGTCQALLEDSLKFEISVFLKTW